MKHQTPNTKTQHTPGPWNTDGDSVSVFAGDGPDRQKICDAAWMTIEVDGARANARLIAAAPDLLSALETVKRWIIEEEQQEGAAMISKETLNNRFQDVRAAIDRATGHPASNP